MARRGWGESMLPFNSLPVSLVGEPKRCQQYALTGFRKQTRDRGRGGGKGSGGDGGSSARPVSRT